MEYHKVQLLLFVIYLNDLPDNVTSGIKLFADDTKIYSTIKDTTDTLSLQNNLDIINEWSHKWLLKFNAEQVDILISKNQALQILYIPKTPCKTVNYLYG